MRPGRQDLLGAVRPEQPLLVWILAVVEPAGILALAVLLRFDFEQLAVVLVLVGLLQLLAVYR
jgi:hypothetical protein